MATVILLHSIYGLRPAQLAAAGRLRAAGHAVSVPDLFAGRTAATVDAGFELQAEIGWPVICARADAAAAGLPADTVLAGFSMGAAVASHLWEKRLGAAGVLFLSGIAPIPENARRGLPLQVHLAEPDPFEEEFVPEWLAAAAAAGLAIELFRYTGVGHLFTDPDLPDHDRPAAELCWQRALAFLDSLDA
jgi:dienelactone hydrolase